MSTNKIDMRTALNFLVKGKMIPQDLLPSNRAPFTSTLLIENISKGSKLTYECMTDTLYAVMEDGTKMMCPDMSGGLSKAAEWISNYLPEVFIDTEQGGNDRKGDEAVACWKVFSIGYIIPEFRSEIIEHFKKCDYDKMVGISDVAKGYSTPYFRNILQVFQKDNSNRINAVISAASYKLSLYKEKNELFYTGSLSQDETLGLSTLSRGIKTIVNDYAENRGLDPMNLKTATTITKLTLINERDASKEALICSSKYGMLYRILKLTSEKIPIVLKKRIQNGAREAANQHVVDSRLSGLAAEDEREQAYSDIVREAYKTMLKKIKIDEFLKYKSDPSSYTFVAKS